MIRRLNDAMVRQAKPNENGTPKKYTDGGQMYSNFSSVSISLKYSK